MYSFADFSLAMLEKARKRSLEILFGLENQPNNKFRNKTRTIRRKKKVSN